jgi:nucleotide-binding universal stress UspA family protein
MRTLEKPVRLSLNEIMVVTELPPWADSVVPYAVSLARQHKAKLHIVQALSADVSAYEPDDVAELPRGAFRSSWRDELQKAQARHVVIDASDMAMKMQFMAQQHDFDLAIVSARRTGAGEISLGKAARGVLAAADCPVVIVGPGAEDERLSRSEPANILHATDFSTQALSAAQHAFSWALEYGSRLNMLHVVEGQGAESDHARARMEEPCLRWLAQLVPEELPVWCEVDHRVSFGAAGPAIVESARELDADLIVLGLFGLDGTCAINPGQTAMRVIREAPCPVLVVREPVAKRVQLDLVRERKSSAAIGIAA